MPEAKCIRADNELITTLRSSLEIKDTDPPRRHGS